MSSFVARAQEQIASSIHLPPESYVEFTGSAAEELRSKGDHLVRRALVAVAIVLLPSIVMGNWETSCFFF